MKTCTIYDGATGSYIQYITAPTLNDVLLNVSPDQVWVEGEHPEQSYFSNGSVKEMPPAPPGDYWRFDIPSETWVDPRTPDDLVAELEFKRLSAIKQINNAIGAIRSEFVTVIPAQDMVYQAKEAEAKAYLADPAPVEADYPFIHAEIGITGDSAWQVAQVYVNQALILRQTAAQLEAVRLGHVAMVEAATDIEAIDAVLAEFNAALT